MPQAIKKRKPNDKDTRFYSTIVTKSPRTESDGRRTFKGVASTPTVDMAGDIVEPKGAKFTLPIPLLKHHDHEHQVGWVTKAKVTKRGIEFEAEIPAEVGDELRQRVDLAWQEIEAGFLRGVSIGARVNDYEPIERGIRVTEWDWYELSLVTIGMNPDAVRRAFKSLHRKPVAATGLKRLARASAAGDSAFPKPLKKETKKMAFNAAKQIAEKLARREELVEEQEGLLEKQANDNEIDLDEDEQARYDEIEVEIDAIDKTVERLNSYELKRAPNLGANAKNDNGKTDSDNRRAAARPGRVRRNLPAHREFTRTAMCLAKARGSMNGAAEIARRHYPDDGRMIKILESGHALEDLAKAAVAAGDTTTDAYAEELVNYRDITSAFIDNLRVMPLIDQFGANGVPDLTRVPFNARVPKQTDGFAGGWAGEKAPAAVSAAAFDQVTLDHHSCYGLAVISQQLLRFGDPSAEAKIEMDISKAVTNAVDTTFVDPAAAAVAGVSPASITESVVGTGSAGATAANFRTDWRVLMDAFFAANNGAARFVAIMQHKTANEIAMLQSALDDPLFGNMSFMGGVLYGVPVIVSDAVTAGDIILIDASSILIADDRAVSIDISDQATVTMDDVPSADVTAAVGAAQSVQSLWQNGLVGIKASRMVTWVVGRTTAVQRITGAAYAN